MSTRGLSYKDAANILGKENSEVFTLLDNLLGGMLLVTATGGMPLALGLFEAKDEFIRLSKALWSRLAEKTRGLGRFDRTERIAAAHAVIVVSSYFEAVRIVEDLISSLPNIGKSTSPPERASIPERMALMLAHAYERQIEAAKTGRKSVSSAKNLSKETQISLAAKKDAESARLESLISALLRSDIPIPTAQRPYEQALMEIGQYYADLARKMNDMILRPVKQGVAFTNREALENELIDWVRMTAVSRYEISFRRLAVDFPEIAFWANLTDGQATRLKIRDIQIGLAELEYDLRELARGLNPGEMPKALSDYYKSALDRPIVETGELPAGGMQIPSLGAAYINPDFRGSEVSDDDPMHLESWWNEPTRAPRSDLQRFLLLYFTSDEAVRAPLLILGQPGSGKSVLTKMLAARLPVDEFVVVRVSLRDVAAEADIQKQIEHALYVATGDRTTWPDLIRASGDALPVILLDGFDELLQATGVSQSDYLERVAAFQDRELISRRPCVIIVTSRTAVADRARIPISGAVVVRLEPFNKGQITSWLGVWNQSNADYFTTRDLKQLPVGAILSQADLASQPLLLLMLALYDADDNALQREEADLDHAQLYERLLSRFAQREVAKLFSTLATSEIRQRVELELMRLSIAALAMFNRGRQWVMQAELDHDLVTLTDQASPTPGVSPVGFREEISPAQNILGKFFFIHEARAIVGGVSRGTTEFLHATFGEYLVARLVSKELEDLIKAKEFAGQRTRYGEVDDGFLYALLSFESLSARVTILEFLRSALARMPKRRREGLRQLLLVLFSTALSPRKESGFDDYRPIVSLVPTKCAVYSANLLLLTLLVGGDIRGADLFRNTDDIVAVWRSYSMLWRSQLSRDAWDWLCSSIKISRIEKPTGRDIVLRPYFSTVTPGNGNAAEAEHGSQLFWTFQRQYSEASPQWSVGLAEQFQQRLQFTCDIDDDIAAHALSPFFSDLGSAVTTFVGYSTERCTSYAHALLRLWMASSTKAGPRQLTEAYDECIELAVKGSIRFAGSSDKNFRQIVLRQLGVDLMRLPADWRVTVRDKLTELVRVDPELETWATAAINSLGFVSRKTGRIRKDFYGS